MKITENYKNHEKINKNGLFSDPRANEDYRKLQKLMKNKKLVFFRIRELTRTTKNCKNHEKSKH